MNLSDAIQGRHATVITLNIWGLFAISIVLLIAFYFQLALHELACPLCLLQRASILAIGFGFLLNIWFGIKGIHYGMILGGSITAIIVALRHTLLHIMPGDPGYGSAFLGLHFYVWTLIFSVLCILAVAVMLSMEGFEVEQVRGKLSFWAKCAIALFVLMIIANLGSTILECGGGPCPSDPVSYDFLDKLRK